MIAAIYARKSIETKTGESIENQINMCREHGKTLGISEFIIYQDEGFSGRNTERPELQRMIQDSKKKRFDMLICYKLDRIARNVLDFAQLVEQLSKDGISFISLRDQFDTSSPMGRAMMYITSVFAQLERETIQERVKDNMIELSKTGRWLGGVPPLGFKTERIVENGKEVTYLVPDEDELEIVRIVFEKYIELKSMYKVMQYLLEHNIGSQYRKWDITRVGAVLKGGYYVKSNGDVKAYLKNKGCAVVGNMNGNGLVVYNQKTGTNKRKEFTEWIYAAGRHKGILEADLWLKTQYMIDKHKDKHYFYREGYSDYSFLTGLIKCGKCGSSMNIRFGASDQYGERFIYYGCRTMGTFYSCKSKYIRKEKLDEAVVKYLEYLSTNEELLRSQLKMNEDIKINKNNSEVSRIKRLIDKNNTAISNLIKKLSVLSDEAATYINVELDRLSKENVELKNKLLSLEVQQDRQDSDKVKKEIRYDKIKNFKHAFEICETNAERRLVISSIVEKITWNNEIKTADIKLLE
jgi:DNA invertase Pin-like site-specific DNA recombinase